jgi:hypothetical protein
MKYCSGKLKNADYAAKLQIQDKWDRIVGYRMVELGTLLNPLKIKSSPRQESL